MLADIELIRQAEHFIYIGEYDTCQSYPVLLTHYRSLAENQFL